MNNQTEDQIQELTAQELETVSGGWAGYFLAVMARSKPVARSHNNDDCGPCNG